MAASSIALAGPASADHLFEVGETFCYAGVFSGANVYDDVRTEFVTNSQDGDTVTATCTFRGMPNKRPSELYPDNMWTRPAPGSTSQTLCALVSEKDADAPAWIEGYGVLSEDGSMTSTKGGTAVATCTFDLTRVG